MSGIFDKNNRKQNKGTTSGFYFGHTEAEGENKKGIQNLNYYFEDYLETLNQIENEKFIIIGRKGAGKSAIAKYIKDSCDTNRDSHCDLIKYNDIEIETLIQHIPSDERKNIELIIFEWLILVRLIKLFSKNESAKYTKQFKKFNDFIIRNSGLVEIDKYHITEVVESKKLEVQIDVLKHIFGSTIGKHIDAKHIKAPFYTFLNPLKEIIAEVVNYEVFKEKDFLILFDDLDIKFKVNSEESNEKLLGLLRAAKNLNTTLFKNTKIKTLLFLRDDIKKVLQTKDSDTSKLFSSYAIELNWYDHDNYKIGENQINLKKFINKRIELNFKANERTFNQNDPWYSLFTDLPISNKTSFKFVLDYTFYRPRDLVLFLSPIGLNDYRYPIDSHCIKVLLKKYLYENINEIKSELKIYFDDESVVKIFSALKNIAKKGFTSLKKADIIKHIEEQSLTMSSENVLNILITYSLLIYIDETNRLYFSYRVNDFETADFDNMNLTLHKAIYNYFYPDQI